MLFSVPRLRCVQNFRSEGKILNFIFSKLSRIPPKIFGIIRFPLIIGRIGFIDKLTKGLQSDFSETFVGC